MGRSALANPNPCLNKKNIRMSDIMIKISCIIPTLNEEENIQNLIKSINSQVLPHYIKIVEIIVVDNGSDDNTTSVARSMGASVYLKPQFTIGGMRNYGAEQATGDILFFLDADNILTEYATQSLVKMILSKEVGAIGIQLRPYNDYQWIPKTWYYHLRQRETGYHEKETIASGAFIMRKDVFVEVGGFTEALDVGEDTDLSRKVRKRGYKIYLNADSLIYNTGYPKTILSFIKREFWHGDSWQTIIIHKKIDPLTVYLLMNIILFVLSAVHASKGRLKTSILSIAYVVLPSIIKAYEKCRKINLMFYQLIIVYVLYIVSRTLSLFKFKRIKL